MDIDRFLHMLEDPARGRAELISMRQNAIAKNAIQHVHLAERALDARFPDWRAPSTRKGGSKPTEAMFQGEVRHCSSEKEAYVWLMERFIQHYPKPFETIDWETKFVAVGARTLYFAKSLKALFKTSPDLASDPNKYCRLSNGWYAKLVLSEKQKVELLMKFGTVSGLLMGRHWDWNQRAAASPQLTAEELLREMESAA